MENVWLGLGSNIGDRLKHITEAVESLGDILHDVRMGGLYETAPRDYLEQDDFLNTVIAGKTDHSPEVLLLKIQEIERKGGRARDASEAKGPRTIDIDILLFGNRILSEDYGSGLNLKVPHPSMHERLFVLKPLSDLDSTLKDPRDGQSWESKASHLLGQRVKLYRS